MKLFYEKYVKLAHIGKGANAHVYKVRHAELGYVRAIKILNEYIESKGERAYQSFLKECKTLLAIGNGAHPNIIRIYGPDLIDNRAIVEMDYVQGMTLDSYIKDKGFLDYEEVKTFIHDIVGALAYTHHDIYKFLMNPEEDDLQPDPIDGQKYVITPEKEAELVRKYGIAHNDLHSNNVMRRDYDGSFVLLDFGLAVQDGKCIKSSRMADGNPEYQAPEKFDSETVDPRSDVYSLGILMYEMLAGKVPFELETDYDGRVSERAVHNVLNKHNSETPAPIYAIRKAAFEDEYPRAIYKRDYPEWLDEVIMKCLQKNPKDRYKDAKELLNTINTHIKEDGDLNLDKDGLKEELSKISEEFMYQKRYNSQLSDELQELRDENKHLLKQLYKSAAEPNDEKSLEDKISELSEQLQYEKAQSEALYSQLSGSTYCRTSRKWKLGTIVLLLLSCVMLATNLYFYKQWGLYNDLYIAACNILEKEGLQPQVYVNGEQVSGNNSANSHTIGIKKNIATVGNPDGVLTTQSIEEIDSLSQELRNLTGTQLYTLVVNTVETSNIDKYATDLFNILGIGSSDKNDGVLFLVVLNERSVVIRTGKGIESILTNDDCKKIIQAIMPSFRKGNYNAGTVDGVQRICSFLMPLSGA